MRKTILLVLFVLLVPKTVLGQYRLQNSEELNGFNSIPKEEVFIHFNDNLLLSGEYLYFTFYCLKGANSVSSDISKIGYVALVGKDGALIFQHKINLVDGLGQGDFFVPVGIRTGHYKLVGYTRWMRNQGEQSFFVADLAIVNPYQELPKVTNESPTEILAHSKMDSLVGISNSEEKTNAFKVLLPKRTYGKRQLVKFDIHKMTEQGVGNLSISVRKKDAVKIPFPKKSSVSVIRNTISPKKRGLKLDDSIYLPELRGELISGQLISKLSKQPATNENIGLSIAGDNGLTKVSRTNQNGAFYFNLDADYRNDRIIFDILGNDKNDLEIVLDSSIMDLYSFDFKELEISPELNPVFEQRSIYNQIENAFFEQKADSIIPLTHTMPAYKDFQEVYDLDDYTRFPTLQETIIEIIEDVLVKKRRGEYAIQVRGNNRFFIDSEAEPLVLADNFLVQNTTELFEYNVKKIKRIGISRSEFYMGPKKYQGVFSIETKDGDYATAIPSEKSVVFDVSGPMAMKKYYVQDYSSKTLKNTKHTADFRQQLLWLPAIKIDTSRTFEFYTSDNTGTYEISIEGFSENESPVSLCEKIYVE